MTGDRIGLAGSLKRVLVYSLPANLQQSQVLARMDAELHALQYLRKREVGSEGFLVVGIPG